jgi:hypothetical protein
LVGISTEGLTLCEECVVVVYLIADTPVSIPDELEVGASDDRSVKRVRVRIEVRGAGSLRNSPIEHLLLDL